MDNQKVLAIYGAGGQGREVLDVARAANNINDKYIEIVLVEDSPRAESVNGVRVLSFDDLLQLDNACVSIAVGEPQERAKLRNRIENAGLPLETVIHPSAFIGSCVTIGQGVFIGHATQIGPNTNIGDNVYICQLSNIGHDTVVGRDTFCSAGILPGGNSSIGEQSFVGLGSIIKEGCSVGSNCIVAMGAVVMNNVSDGVTVAGNPARVFVKDATNRVFKK